MFCSWLRAFLLTQIIEVPIYSAAFRCGPLRAFGASLLTHPLVFWFYTSGGEPIGAGWRLVACELFAWWFEALYFALVGYRRVVVWTLVANSASFSAGCACSLLFGGV